MTEEKSRPAHVSEVVARLRQLIADEGLGGVVLTGPSTVAWATGGMNRAIDRALPVDMVWVAVSADAQLLVTTEVEYPRVRDDSDPEECGFTVVAVPWYDPGAFVAACEKGLATASPQLGSDGHPAFGFDLSEELTSARLVLTDYAKTALRELGADTVQALEVALSGWRPGTTDSQVQGEMVRQLELRGAEAVVALVAGDERVARYRHPLSLGLPAFERMMAVIVSRRGGLNVAATRFVSAESSPPELEERFAAVRQIETEVLAACSAGATYGEATAALVKAYREVGYPEAWREHWQGGPIGYGTREFELAPGFEKSPFWSIPVAPGHALAWNPSLGGGAKVEDTFVVTEDGLECVTSPRSWPVEAAKGFPEPRAAVLVLSENSELS